MRLKFYSFSINDTYVFAATFEFSLLYGEIRVPSEVPSKNTGFRAVFVIHLISSKKNSHQF